MGVVQFRNVSHTYHGGKTPAVDDLTLDVRDGELLTLVGPSGSGKSTALRLVAGLESLSTGEIFIGDMDVSDAPPKDRDIAMVFQNFALYPHMTVAENMGFALKVSKISKADIKARVERAADLLDLRDLLDRRPKALSGGQRQRVAMGRAIVREPAVFLMDEPLSNLDQRLRLQTRGNIAELQQRLGTTMIYVTHDQVEAMTLGHRVAVLDHGVLQQVATPRELYDRPESIFVAGFIGSPGMNLITTPVHENGVHLGQLAFEVPPSVRTALRSSLVTVGLRPESVNLGPGGAAMHVEMVEEHGADSYVHGTLRTQTVKADIMSAEGRQEVASAPIQLIDQPIVMRSPGRIPPSIGSTLRLVVDPDEVHFFDPTTGRRLN